MHLLRRFVGQDLVILSFPSLYLGLTVQSTDNDEDKEEQAIATGNKKSLKKQNKQKIPEGNRRDEDIHSKTLLLALKKTFFGFF